MPELPEVESVRRLMSGILVGHRVNDVEVRPDEIVLRGLPPEAVSERLRGAEIRSVGRRGKYFWFDTGDRGYVLGHLGMSGWVRELGGPSIRLHSHGEAPLDDAAGEPRFLKMRVTSSSGRAFAFTDGRRLARIWLADRLEDDPGYAKLGPDAWQDLPAIGEFTDLYRRRKAPIKALLLQQEILAGIGNWIADEVLYRARIAPMRVANTLSEAEYAALRQAIVEVLDLAVSVDADYQRFPDSWLFHVRWGGGRGAEFLDGQAIVRETVGGRTTAWVPEVQR
ncbi:MAG: DNA-formamidopyrimidine glycosylase family protein [Fimbriimonadaceae bacterium]|nr:DNA-formamidopyrimidine glycosylase family protein [Fimbriimonadaceae bacterium]